MSESAFEIGLLLFGLVFGAMAAALALLPRLRAAQVRVAELLRLQDGDAAALADAQKLTNDAVALRTRLGECEATLAEVRARHEMAESQRTALDAELKVARNDLATANHDVATARETIRSLQTSLDVTKAERDERAQAAEDMRLARDQALLNAANAKKDVEQALALHEQTKAFVADAGEKLTTQFKALSAQELDQRGKVLGEQHAERLGAIVQPLSAHLKSLQDKIDLVEKQRAEDRGSTSTMLENLIKAQTMLQTEASQLAKSLRGNAKARGDWGETILRKVLEASGLAEGRDFIVQDHGKDEEGRVLKPDIVVKLPDSRSVVIDSKVSLEAHTRYVNAENEDDAAAMLVEHVAAVRARIKELGQKNYASLYGVGCIDFVLMFVPIEGALAVAVQDQPELQAEALARKVALVSPMTLHIALKTIENVWRVDTMSKSMQDIVEKGRLLYEEASRMGEYLLKLDKALHASRESFDSMRKTVEDPSRGIIRRAMDLSNMGVAGKAKAKMPKALALAAGEQDDAIGKDASVPALDAPAEQIGGGVADG
ncbi:MAG: DNA recombination protein RmuC [Sulfuricaulis sp.]